MEFIFTEQLKSDKWKFIASLKRKIGFIFPGLRNNENSLSF